MSNDAEPQTKNVVINWVEESHHRVVVRVRGDFNADEFDLANGLAELSDDGFECVERAVVEIRDAGDDEPTVEFFDPPRYGLVVRQGEVIART